MDVINHLKSIFARHGIPNEVISDNGPQYSSQLFKQFAQNYNFTHKTSSPKFPQSNGEAERAVKTIKDILLKNEDPYLGLLAYRTTGLHSGVSPAELSMGRKLRTTLPALPALLFPKLPNHLTFQRKEDLHKEQQKTVLIVHIVQLF